MQLVRFGKPRAMPRQGSRRCVDRFGGPVEDAGMVEVGEYVLAPLVQRLARRLQLFEGVRQTGLEGLEALSFWVLPSVRLLAR